MLTEWVEEFLPAFGCPGPALWPTERADRLTLSPINHRFAAYRDALGLPAALDLIDVLPEGLPSVVVGAPFGRVAQLDGRRDVKRPVDLPGVRRATAEGGRDRRRTRRAAECRSMAVKFLPPGLVLNDEGSRPAPLAECDLARGKSRGSVVLMSGCRDLGYSYDAPFNERPNGAFTRVALDELTKLDADATTCSGTERSGRCCRATTARRRCSQLPAASDAGQCCEVAEVQATARQSWSGTLVEPSLTHM